MIKTELPLGPLGEPGTSDYLTALRQQMAATLGEELHSERARGLLDMTLSVFDHLIARDHLDRALTHRHSAHQQALTALCGGAPDPNQSLETALEQLFAGAAPAARCQPLQQLVAAELDFLQAMAANEAAVASRQTDHPGATKPTPAAIEAYLQRRARDGQPLTLERIGSPLGGYSKDVFVVHLSGPGRPADTIVIRRDLCGGPLESSVENEFGLLQAMHEAGVPVAEPLWMETDASQLGGKLLVLRFVEGQTLTDFRANLQAGDMRPHILQFARILAQVHQVPVTAAGVDPHTANLPLNQLVLTLLDAFRDQWRRRRQAPNPIITAGLEWMRNNLPDDTAAPVIVHGDYSLRNLMFANGEATALLDWETWHAGDPAEDLAYCREEVESVMPWAEFMAEYRAAGGPAVSAGRLHYWQYWKYLRGAITSVSMMNAVKDQNADIRTAFGGIFFTRFCLTKTAEHLARRFGDPVGDDLPSAPRQQ